VAQHIITALLVKEPVDRLGTVAEGRDDGSKDDHESLKSHDFFKEIDWTALEEGTLKPPFVPPNTNDTANFDKEFTEEAPILDYISPMNSKIAEKCRENFKGFSFVAKE